MHNAFLHRCLELAEAGRGKVSPNPLVGCVIVKEGAVITEGAHRDFGGPHAEAEALEKAGDLAKGATLYINLEPCCTPGKQPPCTDAIIKAGIKTVVFGARDPSNPGAEKLREAGIEVIGPRMFAASVETPERASSEGRQTFWTAMEAQCRRQNKGFFSLVENGRPWITIKKAMRNNGSIDGKITNEEQDVWSHQNLRATHDAILVGAGTVIADNPQLNIRHAERSSAGEALRLRRAPRDSAQDDVGGAQSKHLASPNPNPRRIILDPKNEVSADATVLTDAEASRTIVIHEKLPIPELLEKLKNEGIASVLVEGGPKVWESFEKSGCADEVVILTG